MPRLKRTRDEAELDLPQAPELAPELHDTLTSLRNMWEFSSLMQYIFLFGSMVKIDDDFDIEDLESECLKPAPSERLAQIGLQFLKYVSSHRGLTLEIFDEYTRRQYVAKAPSLNPFGTDEEPAQFNDFDVFTKIRVLHQLSQWMLINVDRFRAAAPVDDDHTTWRMEPLGWDRDDRAYYVLDDNRLYRRADEPVPPPSPPRPKSKARAKPKAKPKPKRKSRGKATRASKRLKLEYSDDEADEAGDESVAEDADETVQDDTIVGHGANSHDDEPGYGFTRKTWECIAVTLEEYQQFLADISKSKDPNEKELRKRIEADVMPVIEKRAEQVRQKQLKKIRELENLQKMATAKRSSRLADKADREKEEREQREVQQKHDQELKMAREEAARQRQIEESHESRRQTREQRLKEREVKRILQQDMLDRLKEHDERRESQGPDTDSADGKRVSQRQTTAQRAQIEKELSALAEDDEKWYFDCAACGLHGENLDDGTHSIACDNCNVWQHSKCHGIAPEQAEKDGFVFVCRSCKRIEEEAKRPKAIIRINKPVSSPDSETKTAQVETHGAASNGKPVTDGRPVPFQPHSNTNALPPISNFAPRRPSQSNANPPFAQQQQRHEHQHYSTHQNAVAAAGGHPGYVPSVVAHSSHQNGAAPRLAHAFGSPPRNAHAGHQQQQHSHRQAPEQFKILQYQPGASQPAKAAHAFDGASSPVKSAAQLLSSPPEHLPRPMSQHKPLPSLHQSPKPALFPPTSSFEQNGHSPVKSSPPAMRESRPPPTSTQLPALAQTPQSLRPPAADGRIYQTPTMPSVRNGIAADGMSGPWPEGSKAIPQKHDQSPAPPSSSQAFGEKSIFPPVAALAPSPSQQAQAAATAGSIPVKRLPEEVSSGNGSFSSPHAVVGGHEARGPSLPEVKTPTPAAPQPQPTQQA